MTLDQHLLHLVWLMQKFPDGWRAHCRQRARELSTQPEFADLPRLLTEAMQSQAAPTTTEASA